MNQEEGLSVQTEQVVHDADEAKIDKPMLSVFKSTDGIRLYWFLMLLFVLVILVSAVATAKQTQERHDLYQELVDLRDKIRTLKIEEQRLIIEQQTFSATPHIAKRSVVELKMFYPNDSDRLVLIPPATGASEQTEAP